MSLTDPVDKPTKQPTHQQSDKISSLVIHSKTRERHKLLKRDHSETNYIKIKKMKNHNANNDLRLH